ncbi:hypothetical protein ECDEC7A_5337 [Escherichia coli DEC7A]|nr:hypothetical protein ECDEC7A_5337 [Escherichia coli DEC7A]
MPGIISKQGGAAVAHNKIISQRPIRGIKNISGLSRNHLSVIIGAQRADGSSCQKSPIGVHLGKVAIFIFDALHPPPKAIECSKASSGLIGTAHCPDVRHFCRRHLCHQFTQAAGFNIQAAIIICTNRSIGVFGVSEAHRVRAADMFGGNHILWGVKCMVSRRQTTSSNSGAAEISHRGFIKFTDQIALLVINGNIRAPRRKLAFILGKVAEYLIRDLCTDRCRQSRPCRRK